DPLGQDEGVVAEHEAVRAEIGRVDAVGHGDVDTGKRVFEVGAEGPVRIVDEQARVRVVVRVVLDVGAGFAVFDVDRRLLACGGGLAACGGAFGGHVAALLTCGGHRRGCRRRSGDG